ncbi:Gfo/Idh/MocA family protein [Candidatus Hydrogenedentota bacterium]
MNEKRVSRRTFIKSALASTATVGAPMIIPASALGLGGRPAPSDRIVMGCIGVGGMGINDMRSFLQLGDAQVVAVCDVDAERRETARRVVDNHYAGGVSNGAYKGCASYNDFREVIARNDIDALCIALPDHWHAIPVMMGARSGKDIFAEKPLGLTIEEGRIMSDTVKRYDRVFQTGTQLRSRQHIRYACELVRNGRLGKIHTVWAGCMDGKSIGLQPEMPVPAEFDYETWIGPAPWAPYTKMRCHANYRWILDYAGGQVVDHGAHYFDLAQWGLGAEHTGPVEFEGHGDFPKNGLWDTATDYNIECNYASGVKLICTNKAQIGTTFEGSEGTLYIDEEYLDADPPSLITSIIGPDEEHLYKSADHQQNFLDCVKSRRLPVSPIEVAHRTATIGHICNVAMKLQRKVIWNPNAERFVNDPEADRMMSRAMRGPWHL